MNKALTAATCLLAAATTAGAADNLISPCFGPAGQEVYVEAMGIRSQGKTNQLRYNFIGSSQTVYYGVSDWLTLTVGGYEAWDKGRTHTGWAEEDYRFHYREWEYETSIMLNGALTDRDFVSLETHIANNRNSLHEHETQLEITGYYFHQGKRFCPFFDFGIEQSIDLGRNNDLAGFGDLGLYTKLTDNSGLTVDLALSHASATGQRLAAILNVEYGYQFSDKLGVMVGIATLLRDSGKHNHNDEPYDRQRWSTSYHAGFRFKF